MFPTKAHGVESVGSTSDSSTDTSVFEKPIEKAILNPADDVPSLPPTDHGSQAYLVLAGCTFIQAPVWGQHIFRQFGPHTNRCRILDVFWCFPKLLYCYWEIWKCGKNRHSWDHAQRAHVFNDACDFYPSDEISSITTIHWTFGSLPYCCKLNRVVIRGKYLAAYPKSGCPLRGCR